LNSLLSNFLQWLTARKAWKGRRKVSRAFYAYYKKHGIEEGSELAKMRYNKSMKQGMCLEDFSKLEAPVLLAFLSSTVPAVFWAIFELFSNPQLLAEFRSEIKFNAVSISEDGTHTINITALKKHCPFALSFLQEVLRFRTTTITLRHIIEDTMLGDKYLLKKGGLVSIPANAIGKRADVWGDSAGVFDPRRFLKADPAKANSKEPRRTGGFTAFGIAPVICPGRHFASTEVLGVAAMMALRYDINPVGGIWKAPSINTGAISSSMSPVKGEFPVNVKPREEYEGAKWTFLFEEGQGQFTLNVG
jgi:cytochrome P450